MFWAHFKTIPESADHIQGGLNSKREGGAGDGARTRYLNLGKVALYQVSYSRVECHEV